MASIAVAANQARDTGNVVADPERMERGTALIPPEVEPTPPPEVAADLSLSTAEEPRRPGWCRRPVFLGLALAAVVVGAGCTAIAVTTSSNDESSNGESPGHDHHGPSPAPSPGPYTPPVPKGKECSLGLADNCAECDHPKDGGNEVCTKCKKFDLVTGADLVLEKGRCAMSCQGVPGCKSCHRSPNGQEVLCDSCTADYYLLPAHGPSVPHAVGTRVVPAKKKVCVPFDEVPNRPALQKFYTYRATDAESYPFGNCDGASALGVLGYILHEVVGFVENGQPSRKFGIDRIKRSLVYVQNPPTLHLNNPGGSQGPQGRAQFGPWNPFDAAACSSTNASAADQGCKSRWENYGFNVGCQKQWCPACSAEIHRESNYYDFPGACPMQNYKEKNAECAAKNPGGQCNRPNGRRDCTWNVTDAGEILLDDLAGISQTLYKDFTGFQAAKQCEFDRAPPGGCIADGLKGDGLPFWGQANLIDDPITAQDRLTKLEAMFKEKFPEFEEIKEEPVCDW